MSKYTASDIRRGDYVRTENGAVEGRVAGHTTSSLSDKPALFVLRPGTTVSCTILVEEVGTVRRAVDVAPSGE